MIYRVVKDYEPHAFKVGDIVGINDHEPMGERLVSEGYLELVKEVKRDGD